jgi:2'-5' RNA ligase
MALWPPADTARALGDWARAVQRDTGGRATADNTIHLTLAFLGDADPAKAIAAARRVRGKAFDLPIDASQYWKHNKIVWAGPQTMPPALKDMVHPRHGALADNGFVLEKRPFAAHITLLRKAATPKSLPPLPLVRWPAPELVLVRSTPTNTGSRYETIERFALAQDS